MLQKESKTSSFTFPGMLYFSLAANAQYQINANLLLNQLKALFYNLFENL